jgi:hypothetical protein
MTTTDPSQPGMARLGKTALIAGVSAMVLCVALGWGRPTQFLHSYLFAFIFWIGLPLGCSAILMLHHLVGGTWGFPVRRLLESGSRTFYLMAVLILPVLFRLPVLYPWADPDKVKADPVLQYKQAYLNEPFFLVRTAIYLVSWLLLAYLLNKWSQEQDETGAPGLMERLQKLSGPGLLIFGLTVTYASVDWVMSLEPSWSSTIYGMIFMVTEALAAMSAITVTIIMISKNEEVSELVSPQVLNDYGNLLLTFTMLWAYLSFSQFLIIWAGNLQDEIPWYAVRAEGKWAGIALLLVVFHFAVPFLLLLSRFVKRRAEMLKWVAAGLFVMSIVDIYWLTVPAYEKAAPEIHLTDVLALVGVGGLWMWQYASQVAKRPPLPLHDPRLEHIMHELAKPAVHE